MYNPMVGVVTSEFSRNRRHPVTGKNLPHWGIDIAARGDTRIRASYAGIVEVVGYNKIPYRSGQHIFIRNPDGEGQFYGHISKAYVNTGNRVSEGQVIAEQGATGNVTGAHLHFEVHNRGSGSSNGYSLVRNPRIDFNAAGITPGVNTKHTSKQSPSEVSMARASANQVKAVYEKLFAVEKSLWKRVSTTTQVKTVYEKIFAVERMITRRFDDLHRRVSTANQVKAVYEKQHEFQNEILAALDELRNDITALQERS